MNWKNVTIKRFIALYEAQNKTYTDDLEKVLTMLAALHDKPVDHFESIPGDELKRLIREMDFIREDDDSAKLPVTFKLDGERYALELYMSNLTASQSKELDKYMTTPQLIALNYHKIIAQLVYPIDLLGRNKFKKLYNKTEKEKNFDEVHSYVESERERIAHNLLDSFTMDKVFAITNYYRVLLFSLKNGMLNELKVIEKKSHKDMVKAYGDLAKRAKQYKKGGR